VKRIRQLGLGVVMALALSGIGAASASADTGLLASKYKASFRGAGLKEELTASILGTCTLKGELNQLGQPLVQAASPTTTVTPTYSAPLCSLSFLGEVKSISMGACKYFLNPQYGTMDIGPSGCGPIKFNWASCTGYLYPKAGLPAKYTNVTASTVQVEVTGEKLKFDLKNCIGEEKLVSYTASAVISSYDANEMKTSVQVATIPGVYVSGSGGGNPVPGFRSESPEMPVEDSGATPSSYSFTSPTFKGSIDCSSTDYLGKVYSNTVELKAQYAGCTATANGEKFAAAAVTSCPSYVQAYKEKGPPYLGFLDVLCLSGQKFEFLIYNGPEGSLGCTLRLPFYTGGSGVSAENVPGKAGTGVSLAFATSLVHERVGANCGETGGTSWQGTLKGSTTIVKS
jgi:hypothetical protein